MKIWFKTTFVATALALIGLPIQADTHDMTTEACAITADRHFFEKFSLNARPHERRYVVEGMRIQTPETGDLVWDGDCDDQGYPTGSGRATAFNPDGTKIWYWIVAPESGYAVVEGRLTVVEPEVRVEVLNCRSGRYRGNGEVRLYLPKELDLGGLVHFHELLTIGVRHLEEHCRAENPTMPSYDILMGERPAPMWRPTGALVYADGPDGIRISNFRNDGQNERLREVTDWNRDFNARRAERERIEQERVVGERRIIFKAVLDEKIKAGMSGEQAIENVVDLLERDRTSTLLALSEGRNIWLQFSAPDFQDGRFVVDNHRMAASDIEPLAKASFDPDRWFSRRQLQGYFQGITLTCIFEPSVVARFEQDKLYVVHATLVRSTGGTRYIFDCGPRK